MNTRTALVAIAFLYGACTQSIAQTGSTSMPTLPCCRDAGERLVADLSTGQFVAYGGQDIYWSMTSTPSGGATASPAFATGTSGWYPAPAGSNWIEAIPGSTLQQSPAGYYTYHLNFLVAQNPGLYQNFTLSGFYASDDDVISVKLNTVPIPGFTSTGLPCCSVQHPIPSLPIGLFHPGVNMLDVVVRNTGGPSGLLFSAHLMATCSRCLVESDDTTTAQHTDGTSQQ